MNKRIYTGPLPWVTAKVLFISLLFIISSLMISTRYPALLKAVYAAEGGHGGGGHGSGSQGGGHESGGHESGGHESGGHESGGHESDGKGRRGQGAQGTGGSGKRGAGFRGGAKRHVPTGIAGGGRPVWAKEGIPQVELGRLNVSRAPAHVLDRALAEALKELNPSLYSLPTLDAIVTALRTGKMPDGSEVVRVDSPLQNLALFKVLLLTGKVGDGSQVPVSDANFVLLASVFLGSASDKNLPVSESTVKAVTIILGVSDKLTDDQKKAIAAGAEEVRKAILIGHDGE